MNDDDLNMNELAVNEETTAESSDSTDQAAMETPQAASTGPRRTGSLPRLLLRVSLGLVTVIALANMFFHGGNSSGLQVDDASFVLDLKPAESYGQAYVEFEGLRLDDENSIQQILSEQSTNAVVPKQAASSAKPIVLRTAGGVSQKEIDRISRLIRQGSPAHPIVVVGKSGMQVGE